MRDTLEFKKQKPEEEGSAQDQKDTSRPFKDCTITLAVDCSGSTAGHVLQVEKKAISMICSTLTEAAKRDADIVPWNHVVYSAVKLARLTYLESSGGTQPSNLCSSTSSVAALKKSSLWFLMTDGEVSEGEIHQFANAVPRIQLHGTACVIIIFGRRPKMPKNVNVSVGFAVYAVAPHCLVLFHDTATDDLYALRAKGCFESLLPIDEDPGATATVEVKKEVEGMDANNRTAQEDLQMTVEDADTDWAKVPLITYRDLTTLRIPAPVPLSTDHVVLSDGSIYRMDDILSNRLPSPVTARLFNNERDLTSVLTTAGSRGHGHRADEWLTTSRDAATASGDDYQAQRSFTFGQNLMRESRNGRMASLGGLGRSSRGPRLNPADGNLSTASTLVGLDDRMPSSRTMVEDEEDSE